MEAKEIMGLHNFVISEEKVVSINELKYKKHYEFDKCINYYNDTFITYNNTYNKHKNRDIEREMTLGYMKMLTEFYSKGDE